MRPLDLRLVVLALVLGAAGSAAASDSDELVDPWKPEPPPQAAPRWTDAPVVDVVDPWKDDQPRITARAPVIDPWAAEPRALKPSHQVLLNPWASQPTARFPDIETADRDPDGIVDPWPNASVPTAHFEDVTIVDPWAKRH